MNEDPLTDILTLASAQCVDVGSLAAGGLWALRFPPPGQLKFMVVVKGACWLTIEGMTAPREVTRGDVFVLPADLAFVLASDLQTASVDGRELFSGALESKVTLGHGLDFFAVGAHIALDRERGKLLSEVLPPYLHIGGNSAEAAVVQWLLNQLVQELVSERPGVALATRQLAQLLCVQAIRSYLDASGPCVAGWVKALSDERLAPALRLMHREPGRAWELGQLAKEVAMSRSSFAIRFKAGAGIPPLTYLQNLRMCLAEYELREGVMPISELGRSLGYSSESAFSSAFKRSSGMAPGRYRCLFAKASR